MDNRVGLINPWADTSYQYMTFIKKVSVPHLCYDRDHLWPQQVNIILLWLFSSIRYVASEMLLVGEGHINREWSLHCSSAWFLIHICLNADSQKHEVWPFCWLHQGSPSRFPARCICCIWHNHPAAVSWHKYQCQFVMCLRLWFAFLP